MSPFLALSILEFAVILLLLVGYRASILRGYARLETYLHINEQLASKLRESHRATKTSMRGHARLETYVQINDQLISKIKRLEKQVKETT
jgi:hypothetical protein